MPSTLKKKGPPKHVTARHKHREVWLHEAMAFVRKHFDAAGYTVPEHVRVGVGWPSKGGTAAKKRRIGEAWHNKCSGDESHEIIISIWLDDPTKVLGVLIHEVIHVTVGIEAGHKKPFVDCMKLVGLNGKPTATGETEELVAKLTEWVKDLGPYPHARLEGSNGQKKQGTRMLKLECSNCGCKVRTTAKWIDEHGPEWPCPCGGTLVAE